MVPRICHNCRAQVDSSWRFCPSCGEELPVFRIGPERLLSDFMSEFGRARGELMRNFESFDATPMFGGNASGFSVKVTRKNRERPKVEVRTFGNVNPADVTRSLERAGVKAEVPKRVPAAPEEPLTKVTNEGGKVVIEMSLPKIASLKDIDISRMESSIEVRAQGRERGYFKIIAIPEDARITGKSFAGGILRLELARK